VTAGTFALGPWQVNRVGYGAMQLSGDGVFGPPRDREEALHVLRTAIDTGVNHIDTAQYYGVGSANELIREALHPYPADLAIVSKVAIRRDADGAIHRYDEPHELRAGIEENLTALGIDRLAAVNLRMMDDAEPGPRFDAQLAALVQARAEGLIDGVGLSNISLAHLTRALGQTDIVCVQNLFSLVDQRGRDLLDECASRGIAFVPYFPLGSARGGQRELLSNPVLVRAAERLNATPAQVALAWLLDLAPNVLLIPGTRTREHLAENTAAATVTLDHEAREELAAEFPPAERRG
jgi:aryl-alcohol dehydrogenase-like predicted oxidoreductase